MFGTPPITGPRLGFAAVLAAVALLGSTVANSKTTPNVRKCISAKQLLPGTRKGVVAVALAGIHGFKLRIAERAKPRDLNYGLLAATCSRAMIRLTWYTDIHPIPDGSCGACDSHEYWVKRRHGGWASLGYFGG